MQPFQRTAAVFDIDDSLLDGNAGTIFTWFLYSNREMVPSVRSQVPRHPRLSFPRQRSDDRSVDEHEALRAINTALTQKGFKRDWSGTARPST